LYRLVANNHKTKQSIICNTVDEVRANPGVQNMGQFKQSVTHLVQRVGR